MSTKISAAATVRKLAVTIRTRIPTAMCLAPEFENTEISRASPLKSFEKIF